ncbi:hypothetical protein HCH_02973 [Hahella chejuensis KCTC 2396]|uniref:Uncharacterized protein n=1 Tax=Hahella chejuensis (strain KCTC 2396) TaxID=349521 RepID=Q2SHY2_HAHCH|nr:hypothetical protein [Hahella chejuensis]ABC29742.1 hypothetical protein HCH_02973 [Hahella chejuensis KCTC 2396]
MAEILVDADWGLSLGVDATSSAIKAGLIEAKRQQLAQLKKKLKLSIKQSYLIDITINELSNLKTNLETREHTLLYRRVTYLLRQIENELQDGHSALD